ncbi:unnamed protein product, partial [Candidula unifasciata]
SVETVTKKQSGIAELQDLVGNKPYILDVDLDFFSTANPFKNMLRHDEEEALRRLYHYPPVTDFSDENIVAFTKRRETQLNQLENVFLTWKLSGLETSYLIQSPRHSQALHLLILQDKIWSNSHFWILS